MRRRVVLLGGLTLGLRPFWAAAIEPSPFMDPLQTASLKAIEWFKALARSLSDIVSEEERLQLITALERLAQDLYKVEGKKRALLLSMEAQKTDVYERARALLERVLSAQQSLEKVGPLLREQYRQGGADIERELTKGLYARAGWVSASLTGWQYPELRPEIIERGKVTLEALRSANVELSRLIADLKALPST